jgi:hypothetical protein
MPTACHVATHHPLFCGLGHRSCRAATGAVDFATGSCTRRAGRFSDEVTGDRAWRRRAGRAVAIAARTPNVSTMPSALPGETHGLNRSRVPVLLRVVDFEMLLALQDRRAESLLRNSDHALSLYGSQPTGRGNCTFLRQTALPSACLGFKRLIE